MKVRPDIEATLIDLYDESRAAWPAFVVGRGVFVSHAASCVETSADPLKAAERLRGSDLYLACACATGDAVAVREFVDSVVAPINLSRISSLEAESEIKQRVVDKLLVAEPGQQPKILEYAGRGALSSWVQVTAVRLAIDLRRHRHRESQLTSADLDRLGASNRVELEYLKGRYRGQFRLSLEKAFTDLSKRQRAVMRMNVVDRLNIAEIGKVYAVHRTTVARWISEARSRLFDETRRNLEKELDTTLSRSEFDSLVGVLLSRLNLSIARLLASQPE